MKSVNVISDSRNCLIELTHRTSDPGSWIVRRWTRFLWFKRRLSSDWFNDEEQAIQFANKMKRGNNASRVHGIRRHVVMQNADYPAKHRKGIADNKLRHSSFEGAIHERSNP